VSEDRTHDLRIMRPTRCQLRYHRFCPTLMPDVFSFVAKLQKRIDVCCRESRQRLRRICNSGRCPRAATAAKAAEMTAAEKKRIPRSSRQQSPQSPAGQKHLTRRRGTSPQPHQRPLHKSTETPGPQVHMLRQSLVAQVNDRAVTGGTIRCTSRRPQKPSPPGDSCTNQSLHLPTHLPIADPVAACCPRAPPARHQTLPAPSTGQ
jgi:hypothetical protein